MREKPACVCYCTRWGKGQKKRAGQGTVTFRWDAWGSLDAEVSWDAEVGWDADGSWECTRVEKGGHSFYQLCDTSLVKVSLVH